MSKRTLLEVKIISTEKRRIPSKHYVYVINVTWRDGSVNIIYRRYSQFFNFQCKLLEAFPDEAGTKNPVNRMIPFLPGKILFGRSHIKVVAQKRLDQLNEYCRALIRLPPKISESILVKCFFESTPEDINPPKEIAMKDHLLAISEPSSLEVYVAIANYTKVHSNEVSLKVGMLAEVIEKHDSGWWFINSEEEQGWVPASFLVKQNGDKDHIKQTNLITPEQYISINSYEAQQNDELSFEKGVILNIIEKNFCGWWKARYLNKEGTVPSIYLERILDEQLDKMNSLHPTEIIKNPLEVSQLKINKNITNLNRVSRPTTNSKTLSPSNFVSPKINLKSIKPIRPPLPKVLPVYYALDDFHTQVHNGISFTKDQLMQVIERNPSGWWYVRIENTEGWAPSDYIGRREDVLDPKPMISP